MNRFKLGIVLEALGLPTRQGLAAAAKLSVLGVQIDAVGPLSPGQLSDTGRRELGILLRTCHLDLSALHCPLRRGLDVAEDLQPRLGQLCKVMQLAFDLGCRKIVAPLPKLPDDPDSPRAATMRESLLALGSFGDRIGTQVALEAGLDPGDKVRDYLNTFDAGSLAVNYDPANFLLNGFDSLGALSAMAGKVVHCHARDARIAPSSSEAREMPVGAGDIKWEDLVATLESIGYCGFITVDRESGGDRAADVAAGVRFLQRFVPING
jgi:L-ribulose-5-phosphate 3-epimerase